MFKKIHIFVLMLIIVLLTGTGCVKQTGNPDAGIEFDEETHDFGTKDEGPNLEYDFTYTNNGNQTAKILEVKPDCSCTVADTWDKSVAPGKSGKMHITLKTTGLQGEITRTIKVKTSTPNRENILLTIKVNVINRIAIIPRNVFLGEVIPAYEKPLSGSFKIENNLGVPLKILEIIPPDAKTTYILTTIEENMKYRVDFMVAPPFTGEEMIRREFRIKTDNTDIPEIVSNFSYFIPPPLAVWPSTVAIDLDQLKDYVIPFKTSINIKSTMDVPIRILDLKLFGGSGLNYEVLEATRDLVYQIIITVPLNFQYNENEKTYFTFKVQNDPKKKLYNIPVKFVKKEASEGN